MDLQGDSPLLRSHGAVLRGTSESVDVIAAAIERRVEETGFRGPAADRFRTQMDDRTTRLRRVARELDDLAATLTQSGS